MSFIDKLLNGENLVAEEKTKNKLILIEGVDLSGKTTLSSKLVKTGLVSSYFQFPSTSHTQARSQNYAIQLATVKATQSLAINKFQIFESYIYKKIVNSTLYDNGNYPKEYYDLLEKKLSSEITFIPILLEINWNEYQNRIGVKHYNESEFEQSKTLYRNSMQNLNPIIINNNDPEDGYLKVKQTLGI